jgi:hypothetical protein
MVVDVIADKKVKKKILVIIKLEKSTNLEKIKKTINKFRVSKW